MLLGQAFQAEEVYAEEIKEYLEETQEALHPLHPPMIFLSVLA